jgi:putative DNA primase/helicase
MPTKKKPSEAKPRAAARIRVVGEEEVQQASVKGSATQYTEVKATERLAAHLGRQFCYCPALGWQQWTGTHWADVSENVVTEVARKKHKSWYGQALVDALIEGTRGSGTVPAIKRLLSRAGVMACVSLSRGVLHVDAAQFDAHPDLLNTPSGVVALRTGDLSAHDPQLFMRHVTAAAYRKGAKHTDWDATVKAIRSDAREYVQTRVGQAITGYQPEDDVVTFLKGGGENGKSTFIGGVTTCMGSYYRQVSDKVLLADAKAHTTELTDLRGLRLAVIEELPEGRHLSVVLLKKITGQEITARRMKQDTMTWAATHTTLVTTNYETVVSETDWGTWRRLERVTFPYTYVAKGKQTRPGQRVGDSGLRARVRNDPNVQEAALAWIVEGARRWYANGKEMPPRPKSVTADTLDWRRSSDLVLRYWLEFLEPDPDAWIIRSVFADHFNKWLKAESHQGWSAQRLMERWSAHDVFKSAHVEATSIKPRPGLSTPPDYDGEGGDGRLVMPAKTHRVWVGCRYREK